MWGRLLILSHRLLMTFAQLPEPFNVLRFRLVRLRVPICAWPDLSSIIPHSVYLTHSFRSDSGYRGNVLPNYPSTSKDSLQTYRHGANTAMQDVERGVREDELEQPASRLTRVPCLTTEKVILLSPLLPSH